MGCNSHHEKLRIPEIQSKYLTSQSACLNFAGVACHVISRDLSAYNTPFHRILDPPLFKLSGTALQNISLGLA